MLRLAERRWRRAPPSPPPLSLRRNRTQRSSKRIRVKRRSNTRKFVAFISFALLGAGLYYLKRNNALPSIKMMSASSSTDEADSSTDHNSTSVSRESKEDTTTDEKLILRPSHLHRPSHASPLATHKSKRGVLGPQRSFSVRCFRSRSSGAALCAHRPVCAGAGGLISLSTATNTATERYTEENSDMPVLLRSNARYIEGRSVHWWEGGHILIHAGPKAGSIVQFARRIVAAHHVLEHRAYYGLPRLHSVVIIASPEVLRRLRYSRSWHRALLDSLSFPQRPDLRRRAALRFARRAVPPPYPRVLVLPSWRSLSPDSPANTPHDQRPIACFRSAVFAAAPNRGFTLERNEYPRPPLPTDSDNVMPNNASDAAALRDAVFRSVLARRAPPARKRIVYVHRARVRAFSPQAAARLERSVQAAAKAANFEYSRLDADGLPVSSVLAALGDAGVVVGVHGTTLLATIFLAPGAAVVEILPYRFVNELYSRPSGSEVHYVAHTLVDGDEYPALVDFGSVPECQTMSPRCRAWYRSDSRELRFGAADERAIGRHIATSTSHVVTNLHE